MKDKVFPHYQLEKIPFDDGTWWISIFRTDVSGDVTQVVRITGETLERALENAKTELNVYLEKQYRIGKTFSGELDKLIAEEQLK